MIDYGDEIERLQSAVRDLTSRERRVKELRQTLRGGAAKYTYEWNRAQEEISAAELRLINARDSIRAAENALLRAVKEDA